MAKRSSSTPIDPPAAIALPTGRAARVLANALVAASPQPPARDKPNVVHLHEKETAESIVQEVQTRRRVQERIILDKLRSLNADLEERHREQVKALLPIGYAMDAQTLLDFLEIGRRMAGMGGAKRAGRARGSSNV